MSYAPTLPWLSGNILHQSAILRKDFRTLCYRLFPQHFSMAIDEVKRVVRKDDIITIDIDEKPASSQDFVEVFGCIKDIRSSVGCPTVIIRSAIPRKLTYTRLIDHQPIPSCDNSLIECYQSYGFPHLVITLA